MLTNSSSGNSQGTSKRNKKQVCVYCGKLSKTTRDHIPPRAVFPKPRSNDLITVPSCIKCNSCASELDERFSVYLSLHVGIDTPESNRLWRNHTFGRLKHNQQLLNTIRKGMKPVRVTTHGGIILKQGMGVTWDSDSHDLVMARVIRGLHFHHFSELVPPKAFVKVNWHQELTNETEEMTRPFSTNVIARGNFAYRFARAKKDNIVKSLWLFQFYEKHWASGHAEFRI